MPASADWDKKAKLIRRLFAGEDSFVEATEM